MGMTDSLIDKESFLSTILHSLQNQGMLPIGNSRPAAGQHPILQWHGEIHGKN